MFFKHASGLKLLFFVEMWERFSFYMVRALLVLYLSATTLAGGLGFSKPDAISLYATYISFAYLTPILGGFVSDRYLGQRRSAMFGGFLMALGHFLLSINDLTALYGALFLIALGNGFFKPCLTSILGQLYDDADESERDSAYALFYMGINIGAILSSFLGGYLMESYGFDAGFVAAGFAMVFGLAIFAFGKGRYLEDAGLPPTKKDLSHTKEPLTTSQKKKLLVVFFLFLATIILVIAWDQMGGLVPIFVNENVDRAFFSYHIPVVLISQFDPFFIVILAPLLSLLWTYLGKKELDPFVGIKLGLGFFFMASAFFFITSLSRQADAGHMIHFSLILFYKLLVVLGELFIIPISWAAVAALSPKQYISRSMGLMLAGVGIGSYLAGFVGSFIDILGATEIFYELSLLLVATGVVCILLNPSLKKLAASTD